MYKKIFSDVAQRITFDVPPAWEGRDIEVVAYPVSESRTARPTPEQIEEFHRRRVELHEKYSVNFKEIGFKFNRDEANCYD